MGLRDILDEDGLVAPFLYGPARHAYRLFTQESYRTHAWLASRLAGAPRRRERRVRVHGWDLLVPDAASFLSTYRELFVNGAYAFPAEGRAPRILDLGANIGLSVLFFKKMHPQARIMAFEADPAIFAYLERNVRGNGLEDVELVRAAAWTENTRLRFLRDGADGGRLAASAEAGAIEVEAVDLPALLKGREFDFLKIDVEGAEGRLLPACRALLATARRVFLEYHSRPGEPQALSGILSLLSQEGFRLHVQGTHSSPAPFLGVGTHAGFDLQLNVFAWREP